VVVRPRLLVLGAAGLGGRRKLPLLDHGGPLFARASYRFEETRRREGEGEARKAAWKQWNSGRHPERTNRYHTLVYRDADPLDAEFEQLATEVFGALLDHVIDVRDAAGSDADAGAAEAEVVR